MNGSLSLPREVQSAGRATVGVMNNEVSLDADQSERRRPSLPFAVRFL